ncbi:MAG TPA: ParB/RepB/Spo0J family partition protein [Ignavibacteria bacterium]|nr:ParB/RepB/Spo0J family partition protein [Ignavibacteria bacterium]
MDNKGGLGKGLSALFENRNIDPNNPNGSAKSVFEGKLFVEIGKIRTNPFQPREDFDEAKLNELANSIKKKGVLQPITVKLAEDGNGYILISGERRLRAAKIAGLAEIPAFIYDTKDESKENLLELALIENVQRDDLNPMELSDSYRRLVDECSLTQEQIAEKVCKQRSTVANFLRLQKLPAEIKLSLRKNEITEGHARTILRIDDEEAQIAIWKRILEENLSVRKLEELTDKQAKKKKKRKTSNGGVSGEYEEIQNKLRRYFGTRVIVKPKTKQTGEIIIEYYSNDDLERIIELSEKQT